MDIEILDLCKENIQPLKKGRKASQLGLALQAEVNSELHERLNKERGEFELAIITYDGPDPLQPRIDYVNWMEQTHIKHGKDCNLIPLLEDTITLLKENEKYKQDPRFIELMVKYIEAQENAVELFQMVYSQGLGTMCSVLYKAWADVLDQAQDFKRADQVYQLGIANRAQPLDSLKDAHAQFQLSVGRKMMLSGGDLGKEEQTEIEPPRQALVKLRKDPGSVRRSHGSAGILSAKSNKPSSKHVTIFQDGENSYDHLISSALQKNKLGSIASSEKNNAENTMKTGTWNKGYNRKEVSRLAPVPSTPSFKVHVDPDAETQTPKLPPKTPSNVLKTRKAELASTNALEVFTSGHSAKKALQSNLELYSGGKEFSFEELRAAYYQKRNNKTEQMQTPMKTPGKTWTPWIIQEETPLHGFSSLSIREEDEVQLRSDRGGRVECETPLAFTPFTPSTSKSGLNGRETGDTTPLGIRSLPALEESPTPTTCHQANPQPLPTILEDCEGQESYSVIRKPSTLPVRKKQLFTDEGSSNVKPVIKSQPLFSIFVDD